MKAKDLVNIMNIHYPESSAYDWDNVGLQVGSLDQEVTGILISLDVTMDVLAEAIQHNANVIVSHHPLVFRPLTNVDTSTIIGSLIAFALQNNLVIYSAHTNFDVAPNGLNTILAKRLQIKNQRMLDPLDETRGLGVIGTLDQALPLQEYLPQLKHQLEIDHVRLIGDEKTMVQTIAVCGGSGSSLIESARQNGADVLITGDVTYHHALDVVNHNFCVVDVGHNVERLTLPGLAEVLRQSGVEEPIHISVCDTDPYTIK